MSRARRKPDQKDVHGVTLDETGQVASRTVSTANRRDTQQETRTPVDADAQLDACVLGDDDMQDAGNVPPVPQLDPPAGSVTHTREAARLKVTQRLQSEGRWTGQAELVRNDMMGACKRQGMDKEQAQQWVYGELDRMYPPLVKAVADPKSETIVSVSDTDSGSIQGLSDLPAGWPVLAENASLSSDIGWVQANRLWIVEERPGRSTVVRLERAASPAPSRSALGWLETSIRSYAKYVDVVAKASTGAEDEGAVMRRERKSVDEVRALLAEMEEASDHCPTCGRPR